MRAMLIVSLDTIANDWRIDLDSMHSQRGYNTQQQRLGNHWFYHVQSPYYSEGSNAGAYSFSVTFPNLLPPRDSYVLYTV
jgi:hypothetical protein